MHARARTFILAMRVWSDEVWSDEAWSDEALFWRRPRLHAFFELIRYEPVAREVERSVIARLNDLDVDWSSIAVEVPTSNLRKIPRN